MTRPLIFKQQPEARINHYWFFYFLMLPILLPGINACKITEPITIQVLTTPEKPLSWNGESLLVSNRLPSLARFSDTDSIEAGDLTLPPDYLNFLSWENVNACIDVLAGSPVIDSVVLDTLMRSMFGSSDFVNPAPLSSDSIKALCTEFDVDRLVCLDALSLIDTLILTPFMQGQDEMDMAWGTYAQEWVVPSSKWRMYDKDGKLLVENSYSDTLVWEAVGLNEKMAVTQLPPTQEMLKSAMRVCGTYFGKQIVPVWNDVKRFYYVNGSSEMKKAANFISDGNWTSAAAIWNEEATKGKPSVVAKASFNMALASEIMDRIELALIWINKSWNVEHTEVSQKYAKILRLRLKYSRKIKTQYHWEQ